MEELSRQERRRLTYSNNNLAALFQTDAAEHLSEENCSFHVNALCSVLKATAIHTHTNLVSAVAQNYGQEVRAFCSDVLIYQPSGSALHVIIHSGADRGLQVSASVHLLV